MASNIQIHCICIMKRLNLYCLCVYLGLKNEVFFAINVTFSHQMTLCVGRLQESTVLYYQGIFFHKIFYFSSFFIS